MSFASSTKVLPVSERKARVASLVTAGKLSKKGASLIGFGAPGKREGEIAESLVERGRRALAG